MECSGDTVRAYFGHMGRWDREAWRATVLAAELNVVLDADALILCDVREVTALSHGLEQALSSLTRWRRRSLPIPGVPDGVVPYSHIAHSADRPLPTRVAELVRAARAVGWWTRFS